MAKSKPTKSAPAKPAKKEDSKPVEKVICRNRRASFQYNIEDSVEAGMVLTGTEVKSLRDGRANLEDAYARLEGDELWLIKADIPEYSRGNIMNHEPKRKRKLLLHRRELKKFAEGANERGFTLVPMRIYFKGAHAKVEIALARGKQLHDKRESVKKKEVKRELSRAMTGRNRGR